MQRRIVDLPEPDGPMIETAWPRNTSRSMPLSTGVRAERQVHVAQADERTRGGVAAGKEFN